MSIGRLDPDFWRGKTVFLTGHTGFKGVWLSWLLTRLGATVTGYSLPPNTQPNMFELTQLATKIESIFGDIRDYTHLRNALHQTQPHIVLHLAAQALVKQAYAQPADTFSTNVMGTAYVLDAIRETPCVKSVVVVTSDKVYDNNETPWAFRETDALGGKEPYGASKACTEIIVSAYKNTYWKTTGPHIATARAGNVIGGGDWSADRLTPDAIRAFTAQRPLIIRNPQAKRPWQHVIEPLVGYLFLAQSLWHTQTLSAYNFGPDQSDVASVSEVANRLCHLWGDNAHWQQDPTHHPYEAHLLQIDSALARKELGWKPQWQLDQGLKQTVAWYRAHASDFDMQDITLQQIEDYLNEHFADQLPALQRAAE
jgi:CDP-glucose 4,6-dehydratase